MKGSRRTVAVVWGPIVLSVMTAIVAAPAAAAGAAAEEAAPTAMRAADMSITAVEPVTTSPAAVAPSWRVTPYAILPISPARRYEVRQGGLTTAWPPTRIHDSYGVPMRIYDGVKRYHPVGGADDGGRGDDQCQPGSGDQERTSSHPLLLPSRAWASELCASVRLGGRDGSCDGRGSRICAMDPDRNGEAPRPTGNVGRGAGCDDLTPVIVA